MAKIKYFPNSNPGESAKIANLTVISASYALTSSYFLGSVTSASYASTASYVQNAQSASYVLQAVSSSYASTISYDSISGSVKNDVYFTIPFFPAVLSPVDATTYYVGAGAIVPSTTATNQDISFGYDFTVIGAVIMASANTAAGTTENSTMSIRNTTTSTSTTIGNFQTNGSTTVIISTTINGLSIDVDAADSFCIQWLTPTWATNPVGVSVRTILICKRR